MYATRIIQLKHTNMYATRNSQFKHTIMYATTNSHLRLSNSLNTCIKNKKIQNVCVSNNHRHNNTRDIFIIQYSILISENIFSTAPLLHEVDQLVWSESSLDVHLRSILPRLWNNISNPIGLYHPVHLRSILPRLWNNISNPIGLYNPVHLRSILPRLWNNISNPIGLYNPG